MNKPVAWINLEAWLSGECFPDDCFGDEEFRGSIPLYTHPVKAQKEEHCCPECGCHFTGEYPFNYTVKELTDEEIHNLMDEIEVLVHGDIKRAMYRMARKVESILNE